MNKYKQFIQDQLRTAGIEINGHNPWDIQVHNDNLYARIMSQGSLGFGEAYMDGWWDAERIDETVYRIARAGLLEKIKPNLSLLWQAVQARLFNRQSQTRARQVAEQHYNLGNDLYESFLDPYNQYTCGYFKDTDDLNQAQTNKLKLICDKLELKPGDKVLDIGCGWGGLCKFAAEHYGCEVTGVTISEEQKKYAEEFTKGLPVRILLTDYRNLDGREKFDKVVSVGMLEHVGYKNYRRFMEIAALSLKDNGLFLLHVIGNRKSRTSTEPWLNKYIFPNSMLPSIAQLGRAMEGLFVMEDWHNFGAYYDKTLMAWHKNFMANWSKISAHYSQRFYRMWTYYLLCCAGLFRARETQLWQIVMSRHGVPGGYQSIR
jgi:cyclopropane-fatty-acyl-phospholipid synthase